MKMMKDANGDKIPIKYVSAYDRARDAAANRILKRYIKARKTLEKMIDESLADLAKVKAIAKTTGIKGNYQITSFDGDIQVSVSQSYRIKLDEQVSVARDLMLSYARRIAGKIEGQDGDALMQIIGAAFDGGRSGYLPYAKILSLLRLNISNPDWDRAKKILTESIKPERSKAYLYCGVRPDKQHDYEQIRLNLADCWPLVDPLTAPEDHQDEQ